MNCPARFAYTVPTFLGGVSEWLKEPVLKTGVPQGTGGSNPSPSATAHIGPDPDTLRQAVITAIKISVSALVFLVPGHVPVHDDCFAISVIAPNEVGAIFLVVELNSCLRVRERAAADVEGSAYAAAIDDEVSSVLRKTATGHLEQSGAAVLPDVEHPQIGNHLPGSLDR